MKYLHVSKEVYRNPLNGVITYSKGVTYNAGRNKMKAQRLAARKAEKASLRMAKRMFAFPEEQAKKLAIVIATR